MILRLINGEAVKFFVGPGMNTIAGDTARKLLDRRRSHSAFPQGLRRASSS